jgi:hypothetical protein
VTHKNTKKDSCFLGRDEGTIPLIPVTVPNANNLANVAAPMIAPPNSASTGENLKCTITFCFSGIRAQERGF